MAFNEESNDYGMKIEIVDFDSSFVCFNNDRKYYNLMISNFKKMIGIINGYLKIDMEDIFYMNSLDEILNVIQNEYDNLKKDNVDNLYYFCYNVINLKERF